MYDATGATNEPDTPNDDADAETDDIDVDDDAEDCKRFILAPTPAQLGRAPLQRRQNLGKSILGPIASYTNIRTNRLQPLLT